MQFRIVVMGALLLTAGLVAYSVIPNIQRKPTLDTQSIMEVSPSIPQKSYVVIPRNVTITSDAQSELKLNVTVTNATGDPAFLRLQVFVGGNSSCTGSNSENYLVAQDVSNHSLSVLVSTTGIYCFTLTNESALPANASLVAWLEARSEEILVSRNGVPNMAGLGVGVFGFLVLFYGFTRKTIIPWE